MWRFPHTLIPLLKLGSSSEQSVEDMDHRGSCARQAASLSQLSSVSLAPYGFSEALTLRHSHGAQQYSLRTWPLVTQMGQWVRAACGEAEVCTWVFSPQPNSGRREHVSSTTWKHVWGGSFLPLPLSQNQQYVKHYPPSAFVFCPTNALGGYEQFVLWHWMTVIRRWQVKFAIMVQL